MPFGWTFAALCALQGVVVAFGWRRSWRVGRSAFAGAAIPVAALAIGLLATRAAGWSADALALAATFGAPVVAMGSAWAIGARPIVTIVLVPVAFVIAWQGSGLIADAAGVAIIAAACLTFAALIAAATSPRAVALGLIVLAIVDSVLVFRGHVAQSTVTLHAVVPPTAAGHPLPALQDATFGSALFGWLDLLAPALAGMLFAARPRARAAAALATGVAALLWAMMLWTSDQIPGTVPALAAVMVWAFSRPAHRSFTVREVTIRPAEMPGRRPPGRFGR